MTIKPASALTVVDQPTHVFYVKMPNKFSHSVVLAHYSSLGLINLPNSQHVAYLSPHPQSSRTPSSAFKAQYNPNRQPLARDDDEYIRQTFVHRPISEVSPLAGPSNSRQTPGRRIIIDTDVKSENVPNTSHAKEHEEMSSISTSRANKGSIQRNGRNFDLQPMNPNSSDGREPVTEVHTSRTIPAETCSSSETIVIIERSPNASQPAGNRPTIVDTTSNRHEDASMSSSRRVQQARPTRTPQPTKSPPMRSSSPIDSAVVASIPLGKASPPGKLYRNASVHRAEGLISNPLPEAANFDGFSDLNKSDEIRKISITMSGSTSKARSSFTSAWPLDTGIASPRSQSNHRRQKSPSLDPSDHHTATLRPMPPHDHELSSHKSLDSSSSLSSLEIPIVERAHPLRANKDAVIEYTDISRIPSYLATSNHEQDNGPSPSSFELSSSSRGDSEARYLEEFRRDLTLRLSVDNYQDREANADSLIQAGADFPPETTMYRFKNTTGRPHAQVEMMLQKIEEETNSKDKNTKKDVGLNNEDRIEQAERRDRKADKASDSGPAHSYKNENAKSKTKEGGGFFQRLRSQKQC